MNAYNVYAYCGDNPIEFRDSSGEFVITVTALCIAAGVAIGATVGGIIGNIYADAKTYQGWDKAKCIIGGCLLGGLIGGGLGYAIAPLVSTLSGVSAISTTAAGGIELIQSVESLGENKIHHIVDNSQHCWELLSPNKNWDEIKWYIDQTLKYGQFEPYKGYGFSKVIYFRRRRVSDRRRIGEYRT